MLSDERLSAISMSFYSPSLCERGWGVRLLVFIAKLLLFSPIAKKHPSNWCKNLLTKCSFLVKKAKHYICGR